MIRTASSSFYSDPQEDTRNVPPIRPWRLPSTAFQRCYSFDSIEAELLVTLLNKSGINKYCRHDERANVLRWKQYCIAVEFCIATDQKLRNIKLSLCLIKYRAPKTYWIIDWAETNAQLHGPAALPRGKGPRYPFDRGWVGLGLRLDAVN
jgi:hypothetical protein